MLQTLEDIRRALGPAMTHLSKDQWDAFSDIFDPMADEIMKKEEAKMVADIVRVMEKYKIRLRRHWSSFIFWANIQEGFRPVSRGG